MYCDLQVNGYAGIDFNSGQLTTAELEFACARLAEDGVEAFLPTIITADVRRMAAAAERLAEGYERSAAVRANMVGIHFEGPFINGSDGYVGAHPVSAVIPANRDVMRRLLDASRGLTRLVTLAPECDARQVVTSYLAAQNVTVSAGHSNPSKQQLAAAIDAGLSMFTHLGNGCPTVLPRHDNVIQLALSFSDRLTIMFIADGVHVPFHALQNYLTCVGTSRAVIVTDAIAAASIGPGKHRLGDQEIVVDEHLATWTADRSHLVGSAMTMRQACSNLADKLFLPADAVARLTWENPLSAITLTKTHL
jgi:N-acetylglucosamine-6-phosphate deacetylase